jgi:hypothetical protein
MALCAGLAVKVVDKASLVLLTSRKAKGSDIALPGTSISTVVDSWL